MSLTSHLKQPQSPVYRFLLDRFPGAKTLASKINRELKGVPTVRPTDRVPYSTIGTALDYRLRYYFHLTPNQELVAWRGAGQVCGRPVTVSDGVEVAQWIPNEVGEPIFSEEVVDRFFASLNDVLDDFRPVGRRLEPSKEELLVRHCIVLAFFEEVSRASIQHSPLFNQKYTTVDALLSIAETHWVDDLSNLSWLFHDRFRSLLSAETILNPTFDVSPDIGGADADLISDGYLLDIKATVKSKIRPQ